MPKKSIGISPKQKETLAAIIKISKRGYPPSLMEIAEELGLDYTGSVRLHLRGLVRLGYIQRTPKTARGLKVLKTAPLS